MGSLAVTGLTISSKRNVKKKNNLKRYQKVEKIHTLDLCNCCRFAMLKARDAKKTN
jgi:hypothetical protein